MRIFQIWYPLENCVAAGHCRVFSAAKWRCSKVTLRFACSETEADGNTSGRNGWGGCATVLKKSYDEWWVRSAPLASR